ncbi:MAG: FAD-dependent oxidoreductase [Prevotellaceae bacterium]|jgi:hypothetical protein|nr:FAD-dependent oxidoreductase [Prevotellaceae bacterium]
MKIKLLLLLVFVLFVMTSCNNKQSKVIEVDVCVYGGTSAGVIAAYTAKQMGKTVLLVEPANRLGGMSSGGLGYTDIGNKYVVKGLARDFYRRLGSHYGKLEQWIFEPSVAERIFNDYVKEAGFKVLYENRLYHVITQNNAIQEIVVENSHDPQIATNKKIRAKVYIDCSYEGDLMAKSGVSYTVGRESNSVYDETYNGVQLLNGHQFPDGIDPYVIKGDHTSGLLWGISDTSVLPNGSGDKKVQAYNYRICLTNNPKNKIEITKPENYDPEKYELLIRQKEKQPWKSLQDIFIWSLMPNNKTDINNRNGFSTDAIGLNWDYPEADYEKRKEIIRQHEDYTKGLLYFVGNDERIPQFIKDEMKQWGYPKDEYADNEHWSPQLYIRESRRMIGELVMTQHHCQGREIVDDIIGWAAYTMDSHNCNRHVVNAMVKNEGNVEVGGFPPYPIAYRSIIPQKGSVGNLLVPVCMSASHIAYGSIRMEPVFMVLAQSAAVAACLSVDGNISVQDVDVDKLRNILETNPLADNRVAEILIDNDDNKSVQILGAWDVSNDIYRGYGSDFLIDNSNGKELKSVKYTPKITVDGNYEIYVYYPKMNNGSNRTILNLQIGEDIKEVVIKQSDIVVEGQTLGEWVRIGEFNLSTNEKVSIEITNKNSDGIITADAVLFYPKK